MSFREPLLLLGLALVPLALAAYVVAQRRQRRFAVRYTNVDVLASVAARVGWTRHIPALLALLALAALLVALGRPERTVAAEQRQAMVVMITDTSGSMLATDVSPNRLSAAQQAGRALADKLPRDFRLGLVGFGSTASLLVEPTTDKARVRAGLDGLRFAGRTAMGDGLALGLEAARTPVTNELGVAQRLPAALVLLSDGANTAGDEDPITVAERARRFRIPVYTVALGTAAGYIEHTRRNGTVWRESVPPDTTTLQEIARETRGRYFAAADAKRLTEIYRGLGTRLASRREKQEITAAFAGGGVALFVFGMVAAMARGGRLP
jgi:Ca-activated chloride channel homolog